MPNQPDSFWKQLAAVWIGTVALSVCLLALQLRQGSTEFSWVVPGPSWRSAVPAVAGLFRAAPLLATALVGLPLAALLLTVVLCFDRVAR